MNEQACGHRHQDPRKIRIFYTTTTTHFLILNLAPRKHDADPGELFTRTDTLLTSFRSDSSKTQINPRICFVFVTVKRHSKEQHIWGFFETQAEIPLQFDLQSKPLSMVIGFNRNFRWF